MDKSLNLLDLIDKYYYQIEKLFLIEKKAAIEEMRYITTTEIVPSDYFNSGKRMCDTDGKIFYKKFDNIYVIFNDIEKSTQILEYCEKNNLICLYISYIKYSSELLAEILNYFDGKMIEITGDGNYSIIENLDEYLLHKLINDNYKNLFKEIKKIRYDCFFDCCCNVKLYLQQVECYMEECYSKFLSIKETKNIIRYLLLCVFNIFNCKINKLLKKKHIEICFNTRIGCEYGSCKITRFIIGNYLKQDKLIGEIVHKAAHQAQGKK